MKLPSFHDHSIVGYEVDAEARCIALKVRAAQGDGISSVIFSEVAGYCFVNDALGNIVDALKQVGPKDVVAAFREQIADSFRQSGAPGAWAADLSTAAHDLEARGTRGFLLSSAFDMIDATGR